MRFTGRLASAGWGLLMLLTCAASLGFDIYAGRTECLFEELHKGEILSGSYLLEDGSRNLEMQIKDPKDAVVYGERQKEHGKFDFSAKMDGMHQICFTNMYGKVGRTSVDVVFKRDLLEEMPNVPKIEDVNRVERSTRKIVKTISMVEYQQMRYRQLNDQHTTTVYKTNRRVKVWTFLECLTVVAVSVLQIYALKRVFPKQSGKRMAV
mmetsp:Transcript_12953/g.39878  ORF Transcript_12953/g.39878 Transcript_12953/m.39878 type:complete len:208 (+) Transcript_12953:153-776(+)